MPYREPEELVQRRVREDGRRRGVTDLRRLHVRLTGDHRGVKEQARVDEGDCRHAAQDLRRCHDHASGRGHGGRAAQDRHRCEVDGKSVLERLLEDTACVRVQLQRRSRAVGVGEHRRHARKERCLFRRGVPSRCFPPVRFPPDIDCKRGKLCEEWHLFRARRTHPARLVRVEQQHARRFHGLHPRIDIPADERSADGLDRLQGVPQADHFHLVAARSERRYVPSG